MLCGANVPEGWENFPDQEVAELVGMHLKSDPPAGVSLDAWTNFILDFRPASDFDGCRANFPSRQWQQYFAGELFQLILESHPQFRSQVVSEASFVDRAFLAALEAALLLARIGILKEGGAQPHRIAGKECSFLERPAPGMEVPQAKFTSVSLALWSSFSWIGRCMTIMIQLTAQLPIGKREAIGLKETCSMGTAFTFPKPEGLDQCTTLWPPFSQPHRLHAGLHPPQMAESDAVIDLRSEEEEEEEPKLSHELQTEAPPVTANAAASQEKAPSTAESEEDVDIGSIAAPATPAVVVKPAHEERPSPQDPMAAASPTRASFPASALDYEPQDDHEDEDHEWVADSDEEADVESNPDSSEASELDCLEESHLATPEQLAALDLRNLKEKKMDPWNKPIFIEYV